MKFLKTPLAGFIIFLILLVGTAVFVQRNHWADVHVYHTSAFSLFRKGRVDLYAPDFADDRIMDYRYPPLFLFPIFPFAYLPYDWAEFLWLWVNLIAVFLAVLAVKRGFINTNEKPQRLNLVLFLSFLVCAKFFFPLVKNLNVHLLILCLIFGAFYLLLKERKLFAAALMALAISIKIVPVLALPYFALKKQWLFLSATLVLTVVFNLLPAFYFGADLNFRLLGEWYEHVIVNNEFHELNGPVNLSLKGQLDRYLVGIDYGKRTFDPDYQNVNFVSLAQNQADDIWKVSALLLMLGTLFFISYASKLRNNSFLNSRFDSFAYHEFGLMICLSLLIAPRSNKYYFVALFFPLVPFLHDLWRRKSKFNLTVFAAVIILAVVVPLVPGRSLQRLLTVLGVDFYLALVLWTALAYNLIKASAAERNLVAEAKV